MAAEAEVPQYQYSQSQFPGRVLISDIMKDGSGKSFIGKSVKIGGWIRSGRLAQKDTLAFLDLNDGTCAQVLQTVVKVEVYADIKKLAATGACVCVQGTIIESPKEEQDIEFSVTSVDYYSPCDGKYPLSKKAHSMMHLRNHAHLRPRSNLMSCVFRVRNTLANATHSFFQERGFIYCNTPIITSSDCEGAGEMLQVTGLLPNSNEKVELVGGATPENIQALKEEESAAGSAVKAAKEGGSKEEIAQKVLELKQAKAKTAKIVNHGITWAGVPIKDDGFVDYSKDFFRQPSYLTVSGQLQAEAFACSMSNTYTFGPTFRAEDSNTVRHLAEFWMIEPEIAFANLEDDMNLAEDYVRYCCERVFEQNKADLNAIDNYNAYMKTQAAKEAAKAPKKKGGKKGPDESATPGFKGRRVAEEKAIDRVQGIIKNQFARISYTDGIELLLKAIESGVKFENPVSWGIDLSSEHERYLAEVEFKRPTIIYNYPIEIKAFYMRRNDDKKTVAAMDIVCPQIGELIGGSQREERLDVLEGIIDAHKMNKEDLDWYLDLRRYGTVPHAGFGLGFERLVLFVTGMENIRDVMPFPRPPGGPLV